MGSTATQRPAAHSDVDDAVRILVSAILSGRYKEEIYLWDVASLCKSKPQAVGKLLLQIDRYRRLGQMSQALHDKIKARILAVRAQAAQAAQADAQSQAATRAPQVAPNLPGSPAPAAPPQAAPAPGTAGVATASAAVPPAGIETPTKPVAVSAPAPVAPEIVKAAVKPEPPTPETPKKAAATASSSTPAMPEAPPATAATPAHSAPPRLAPVVPKTPVAAVSVAPSAPSPAAKVASPTVESSPTPSPAAPQTPAAAVAAALAHVPPPITETAEPLIQPAPAPQAPAAASISSSLPFELPTDDALPDDVTRDLSGEFALPSYFAQMEAFRRSATPDAAPAMPRVSESPAPAAPAASAAPVTAIAAEAARPEPPEPAVSREAAEPVIELPEPTPTIVPPPKAAPRPAAAPAPASAPPAARSESVTVGHGATLCGRYELQQPLGRGGMATVYQALDRYRASLGLEDCRVALKVVRVDSARPAAHVALGREFHSAQRLSHPNVINVFDIDHEGDTTFYTMELLEGQRLNQLLREFSGLMPRRYAFAILRDIGAAIAHAHSRLVVHADLKPHNIMYTLEGAVRVLDFGGLSATPREPWISELTIDGFAIPQALPATPTYASCEQLEGRRADPRDDIYALGCIAYELLAGKHPFNRLSALEARSRRLRPKRPAGLRASCWHALRQALAWQRERRPGDVERWIHEVIGHDAAPQLPPLVHLLRASPPRFWLSRTATAVVALLAVGMVGYTADHVAGSTWDATWATARTMTSGAWQRVQAGFGGSDVAPTTAANNADSSTASAQSSDTDAAPTRVASADTPNKAGAVTAPTPTPNAAVLPVAFSLPSYVVPGSDPAARIIVRRLGGDSGDISFVWWTEEASAKPDVDYASLGRRTERIPKGEDKITIYVPIISNPLRKDPTKFYVALGRPGTSSDNASARTSVTIERGEMIGAAL